MGYGLLYLVPLDGTIVRERQPPGNPLSFGSKRKLAKKTAEYLTYTTEESEKTEVFALAEELGGDLELAIKRLAETKYK